MELFVKVAVCACKTKLPEPLVIVPALTKLVTKASCLDQQQALLIKAP